MNSKSHPSKINNDQNVDNIEAEDCVRKLLALAGEDPTREGVKDTPKRVIKAYKEFFSGYEKDPLAPLSKVFMDHEGYDDFILVKDIPFFSHCEHHMVPFFGKAQVAYWPKDGIVGLSKIARVVDIFARRLQTQERLTRQIIDAMEQALQPKGCAIIIEAEHLCLSMRGVHKAGSTMLTSSFTGIFKTDAQLQSRFLSLAGRGFSSINCSKC